jgi:chromosome partitioning protein
LCGAAYRSGYQSLIKGKKKNFGEAPMAVIAVVNRKGGSGKSTLATHIASYLAQSGADVMLGDVDRQQSSRLWLKLRPDTRPTIQGWTIDDKNFARPPAGVKHVVLDTPGGFQGVGLMKVALYADAILVPCTASLFDRESAADCVRELRVQPRVASGKCKLASVAMRIDARTKNGALAQQWAEGLGLRHLGAIREAQAYPRCLDRGLTLFDLPREKVASSLEDWLALIDWLNGVVTDAAAAAQAATSYAPAPSVLARPAEPARFGGASVLPPVLQRTPFGATPQMA